MLHNTGSPNLAQRPQGLTSQHIANLKAYYEGQGWHAGPHLFVDDQQIWVFSSLTSPGVHSPSWNKVSWGVEQLGDFTPEDYLSGRGLAVRSNVVAALAVLHHYGGLDSSTLRLHKMDPLTTHKDCPGTSCANDLPNIIKDVHSYIVANLS